jgi:uncharacterized protein YbbC (DUF1343 family)
MAGNLMLVVGLVFALLFFRYMLGEYNSTLCGGVPLNETLPDSTTGVSASKTDLWGTITGLKCSGTPAWFNLIYVPFLVGIIYLLIPIPFKV